MAQRAPDKLDLRSKAFDTSSVKGGRSLFMRMGDKFTVGDGCWEWTGSLTAQGYGQISRGSRESLRAHRVLYEILVGPLRPGQQLDHLCRNPRCVNPGHLEPVTMRENILRGESPCAKNARKTHCKNGHPFDERNTGLRPGGRRCRACHAERERARKANR